MFSNDRNIETIGKFIEVFRHYIKLQNEYLRLGVIEKLVRLITAMFLFFVLLLFILIVCIYLSFSAAYAMAAVIGFPLAFLAVAGFYMLLFVTIWIFRHRWVERPLIHLLASILMEK